MPTFSDLDGTTKSEFKIGSTSVLNSLNGKQTITDSLTEINAALVDSDEIPVYDASATANRKSLLSRIWTYISGKVTGTINTFTANQIFNPGIVLINTGTDNASGAKLQVNGAITAADGSASLPSYSNSDDPNTGIYFPAADSVAIATGGTERVRVDSAGRIGIGGAADTGHIFSISKNATGSTTVLSAFINTQVQSDVTSAARGCQITLTTASATFTLSELTGYAVYSSIGAGSTVTNQYGFVAGGNLTGATNNYGFYGSIPAAAGRWNFYAAGTAQNYFAGNVGIGTTSISAKQHILSTTEQLRLAYDGTNVASFTVGSSGNLAIDPVGKLDVSGATAYNVGKAVDFQVGDGIIGWKDLVSDIILRGNASVDPVWAQIGALTFYGWKTAIGKKVYITFHINHDYYPGGAIHLHTHWVSSGTDTTNTVKWAFTYDVIKGHNQSSGGTLTSGTTVYAENASGAQYRHMISETSASITVTNAEVDALIMVVVERVTNGATDNSDDIFLLTVDCHYQASRFATPQRAPNFYA